MIDLTRETPQSVKQVMERFSVSRRTVENWFQQGLESIHLGRRVYTSLEALQRFSSSPIPIEGSYDQREIDRELRDLGVI